MKNSNSRKVNNSIIIILIGIFAGFMYTVLSRELKDPHAVLNGIIIGLIGSSFIVMNEIWIRRMVIRRLKFSNLILLKSLQYVSFLILLVTLVISLDRSQRLEQNLFEYWQSPEFAHFIWQEDFFIIITYTLVVTVIFILIYLISRKMGQGILWNFIIGRYHKPTSQKRIFMYLDINNSTAIAEQLGDVKYHKLLNDFFYDITDSITMNYGKIYRYIGDEVIVSWSLKKGLNNANIIRTYLSAKAQINKKADVYLNNYGIVPEFSAAIHCGDVFIGELGEVKSEISYIGEVLQQTSVLEKACAQFSAELLISKKLFDLMPEMPELKSTNNYTVAIRDSDPIEVVELAISSG